MPSRVALFASVTLALAGANAMQVWSALVTFLFTDQLPQTALFRFVFWLWLPTAIVAVCCGLYGGYTVLRGGRIANGALMAFVLMSCIAFKVSGQELGYSAVRLALNIGTTKFYIGINGLGFLYLWWLITLRSTEERPLRSDAETEIARGRGAV